MGWDEVFLTFFFRGNWWTNRDEHAFGHAWKRA
jgi:hypothetical protein